MKAAGPRNTRRRPRRGSVERPINGPLVRSTLLVLILPVMLAGFTVARPGPLPAPTLPPSFDGASTAALARELARDHPSRVPGTDGADGAASWFSDKLALYGFRVQEDRWRAELPGLGRPLLRNLAVVVRGEVPDAIVVVAHRDNTGAQAGANDNASGTAALIELARAYSTVGTVASRPQPVHTLVFLSSDGGAYGGFGAERFASSSALRGDVRAVVSLDGLAGTALPRLELGGIAPRSPAPALVRTTAVRVAEQLGREPAYPSALAQLVDLGLPFGYGEQAPFLRRDISALRVATAPDGRAPAAGDEPGRLDEVRLAQLGRASEALLGSLDAGIELADGTGAFVYLRGRAIRGWSLQLVLLAATVPFFVGTVDLLARCRRRRLPLRTASLALRTRFGLWLWVGALAGFGAVAGVFPRTGPLPPSPDSPSVTDWPLAGLAGLAALALAARWSVRRALAPSLPLRSEDELAAYAVALAGLGLVALATAIGNPYALTFVLPSLYAWLWLPQVQNRSGWARDLLFGAGLVGPVLAVVSVGQQLRLGLDAPLYVVSLITLGFVPWPAVLALLGWAAVASQLGALTTGRYGPARQSGR